MAVQPGKRKEPEGWLMRLRTQGPGAVRPKKKSTGPARGKDRARRSDDAEPKRPMPASLDEAARKNVARALRSIIDAYPFGLLVAHVGPEDLDMVLKCPSTDLALIADLVKRRLMTTIREAGLGGRFWRKGFLRRALGTEGEVRRAVVQMRREARMRHGELIDRVQHDEKLAPRTRRPTGSIEPGPPTR